MCGHDWCSMRISKEITEFTSGKDPDFQPERRAMRSPGIGEQGRDLLARRGAELPKVGDKNACHSDVAPDRGAAEALQASPSTEN